MTTDWDAARRRLQPGLDAAAAARQARELEFLPREASLPLAAQIDVLVGQFLAAVAPYEAHIRQTYRRFGSPQLMFAMGSVTLRNGHQGGIEWGFNGTFCSAIDVAPGPSWSFRDVDGISSRVYFSKSPHSMTLAVLRRDGNNPNYLRDIQDRLTAFLMDAGIPLPS